MSLKSTLALKIGLTDINPNFTKFYKMGFELQKILDFDIERSGFLEQIRDYTHVNYSRLVFLYNIAEKVAQSELEGAFVETGVWRGGCAGILTYISKKYNYKHPLYFFDSFEGLPEPTKNDGNNACQFSNNLSNGNLKSIQKVKADENYIKELLFDKLKADPTKINIVKGWFQETLPIYKNKMDKIAILRLDGDWYESTKVALDNLYHLVVQDGYIIIDDYYYWDGCRKAVDEFLTIHKYHVKIHHQDQSGAYFIKP